MAKNLTQEQFAERIRERGAQGGGKGVTPAELGRPKSGSAAVPAFDAALGRLVEGGALVAVQKGKLTRYFLPEHAPPPPEELYRREVLAKVTGRTVWLESALVGTGARAAEKRHWLAELVDRGEVSRIEVATSAKGRKAGYGAGRRSGEARVELPDWVAVESAARGIARERIDGSASFEAVAERLGVTPLVVKTAVSQRMSTRGGLQLVRGEAREVRDPSTAGLEAGGAVYFRFRFLE